MSFPFEHYFKQGRKIREQADRIKDLEDWNDGLQRRLIEEERKVFARDKLIHELKYPGIEWHGGFPLSEDA